MPAPADASLSAPEGFIVKPFATQLSGPRTIRVAPNGDIFVAETRSGRVTAMRATVTGDAPQITQIFASGLKQPFGIAFYPPGPEPSWIYVANNNSVVRFAYKNGDLQARGREQVVVKQLSPTSGDTARATSRFRKMVNAVCIGGFGIQCRRRHER